VPGFGQKWGVFGRKNGLEILLPLQEQHPTNTDAVKM